MNKIIKLKELHLKNFKGMKKFSIYFGETTDVYGENASGKTTIFDAFTWIFFDKDSRDRKDFSIKTYDRNGVVLPGLNHEVEVVLSVNEKELKLKKVYREKWTKKRGQATKTLTGHITEYIVNDLPVQKKEYTETVNSLVPENIFKLITNPLYFNNSLSWKKRREILLTVVGDLSLTEVINSNRELKGFSDLIGDKSLEDFQKTLAIRKKKLNEEIKSIPFRLDELNNSIQHIPQMNFVEIEKRKNILSREVEAIDKKLDGLTKDYLEIDKNVEALYSKKDRLREIKGEYLQRSREPKLHLQQQIFNMEQQILEINFGIKIKTQNLQRIKTEKSNLTLKVQDLREEWFNLEKKTLEFEENDFVCPTCGRELPKNSIEDKKAEMQSNFKRDKKSKLNNINEEGKNLTKKLNNMNDEEERLEKVIEGLNREKQSLQEELILLKEEYENFTIAQFEETDEYKKLKEEINQLQQVQVICDEDEINKLKRERKEKSDELDKLKNSLGLKTQYEKAEIRMGELRDREKELGNFIAELERKEFLCEKFIRTKVDLLEERINSKFSRVKFKLFNTLVNGALEECCDTLIDGVPYEDANNAAKFNGGMDIINTLTKHFKVSAPIFIDNRESINRIVESKSQIVNLRVSNDSVLVVDVDEIGDDVVRDDEFQEYKDVIGEGPGF
ncbi:AAA family ATPase [Clostridium sediminicola]|uniref:AAA family ATPase n=1 Tax=Clostridium sediminicola TaxID=3114879 RepID=UPI0031F24DA3